MPMPYECTHGVTQCPQCLAMLPAIVKEERADILELIDLVVGYYPKAANALDNLRRRIKERNLP